MPFTTYYTHYLCYAYGYSCYFKLVVNVLERKMDKTENDTTKIYHKRINI